MGNYRFKLSDMIPNAWFYKLKDMNKPKTTNNHHKKPQSRPYHPSSNTIQLQQNQHFSQPRNSFYYTPRVSQLHSSPNFPHYQDQPRKSYKKTKPHRKTIYKPSPKHTHAESTQTLQDFFHSPSPTTTTNESPSSESTQSQLGTNSYCTSCTCRLSSSTSDIVFDLNESKKMDKLHGFCLSPESEVNLTPIITKAANNVSRIGQNLQNKQNSTSGKKVNQTPARKSNTGVKVRSNSPKLAVSKRIVQKYANRKSLSESFTIVKSSFDPHKDFMESMMEMIVENNIKEIKDLEELLACYLSLNSDEYRDVIVQAFEQIWFSLGSY